MTMDRRKFIKQCLTFSPIIAAPAFSFAAMAHSKGESTEKALEKFILHGDHLQLQNCTLHLNNPLHLSGEGITIHSCNFLLKDTMTAIKIEG